MKKIERTFEVDYQLDWEYLVTIEEIKKDIVELEKLGANIVQIDTEEIGGELFVKIKAFSERLETDEEYNDRISKENEKLKELERNELAALNRPKSKYER